MRPIDADALKQRFLEVFGRCSMWPINVIHGIIDGMPTVKKEDDGRKQDEFGE